MNKHTTTFYLTITINSLLLILASSKTLLFQSTFESSANILSSGKWNIFDTRQALITTISSSYGYSTNALALQTTSDFRQVKSKWISVSQNVYYCLQFDYYTNPRVLTFSPTQNRYVGEDTLPQGYFELSVYPIKSVNITLHNPFTKSPALYESSKIRISLNTALKTIDVYSVVENNQTLVCDFYTTSVDDSNSLKVAYLSNQRGLNLTISTSFKETCLMRDDFIDNIEYYTIEANRTVHLTISKSSGDYTGLTVAVESSDNQGPVGVFGNWPQQTNSIYPSAIIPGATNKVHHVVYIFRNTFTANKFRILVSDINIYESNPISFDSFIDNITVWRLDSWADYTYQYSSQGSQSLWSIDSKYGLLMSGVHTANYSILTKGVELSTVSGTINTKNKLLDTFWNVTTFALTNQSDMVQLSKMDETVYLYGGDDILSTGGGSDTIYLGAGSDLVYVSCQQVLLVLPDFSANDVIDLTGFPASDISKMSIINSTNMSLIQIGNSVIIIPLLNPNISINTSFSVQCNYSAIAAKIYQSSCLLECPCGQAGPNCLYATSQESGTDWLPGTQVQGCLAYSFGLSNYKYDRLIHFPPHIGHYEVAIEITLQIFNSSAYQQLSIYLETALVAKIPVSNSQALSTCTTGFSAVSLVVTTGTPHTNPTSVYFVISSNNTASNLGILSVRSILGLCNGCSNCRGSLPSDCITCLDPSYILDANFRCICPTTSIQVYNTCISCSSIYTDCATCNSTSCLSCERDLIINSDQTCINATTCVKDCSICLSATTCIVCHAGFYLETDTICLPCNKHCLRCTKNICIQCETGFFLWTADKTRCEYFCDPSCGNCTSPSPYDCVYCAAPRTRNNVTGLCECPSQTYEDINKTCSPCSFPCLDCYTLGYCKTCPSSLSYISATRSCGCTLGQYMVGGRCESCTPGCLFCLQNSTCQICADSSYTIKNGQCTAPDINQKVSSTQYTPGIVQNITQKVSTASYVVCSITSLPIIIQGSPFVLLQLFDITQEISYLQYINISYPSNLENFFNQFMTVNLNFLPNIITDDSITMTAPDGFKDSMDALFYRNMSPYIITLGAIVGFYILMVLFRRFGCLHNSILGFILQKLLGSLEWGGFIVLVLGSYCGLCLSCFLQLRNSAVRDSLMLFSYLSAYLFLLMLCVIPFFIFQIIEKSKKIKSKQRQKQYDQQFGTLYQMYNLNSPYQRCFMIVLVMRKFLYSFALVYFNEFAIPQLITLTIIQGATLAAVLIIKPYKSLLLTIKDIATFSVCMTLYATFSAYATDASDTLQRVLGFVHALMISLLILLHLLSICVQTYNSMKELIQDFKEFRASHQTKQAPQGQRNPLERVVQEEGNHSQANINPGPTSTTVLGLAEAGMIGLSDSIFPRQI